MKVKYQLIGLVTVCFCWSACSNNGPLAIFNKLSPHDQYGQRLKDAGLDRTAMGGSWLLKADQSLEKALNITIPYKEVGYFAADKIQSTSLSFEAKRGQEIHVVITRNPVNNFSVYADMFQILEGKLPKAVASADTTGVALNYEIKKAGRYILRLQPELLRGGEYTLTITAGPSLGFPVAASGKPKVGSFWGDGRDEGGRKHEGIDIFAPKRTPAIATNDGTVTRVTENNLGGRVVFMRPDGRDYNLYYAHLDVQLVNDEQTVHTGDTLGLVGNTGNAIHTVPHLHFGIYTDEGAVDPLPFVNRDIKSPRGVTAPLKYLNATVRTDQKSKLYTAPDEKSSSSVLTLHTPAMVEAATENWLKVTLPDGKYGYVSAKDVTPLSNMRKATLKNPSAVYDAPDQLSAARKTTLSTGDKVNILATYKNYFLVNYENDSGWINAAAL